MQVLERAEATQTTNAPRHNIGLNLSLAIDAEPSAAPTEPEACSTDARTSEVPSEDIDYERGHVGDNEVR